MVNQFVIEIATDEWVIVEKRLFKDILNFYEI